MGISFLSWDDLIEEDTTNDEDKKSIEMMDVAPSFGRATL
jgi:hypothetical protein